MPIERVATSGIFSLDGGDHEVLVVDAAHDHRPATGAAGKRHRPPRKNDIACVWKGPAAVGDTLGGSPTGILPSLTPSAETPKTES